MVTWCLLAASWTIGVWALHRYSSFHIILSHHVTQDTRQSLWLCLSMGARWLAFDFFCFVKTRSGYFFQVWADFKKENSIDISFFVQNRSLSIDQVILPLHMNVQTWFLIFVTFLKYSYIIFYNFRAAYGFAIAPAALFDFYSVSI